MGLQMLQHLIRGKQKMEIINGNTVSLHYVGTLDNGDQFDSSYDRDTPMTILVGSGKVIPGLESAMMGMKAGEKKSIAIESKDAYGERNPDAIQSVSLGSFPEDFIAEEGKIVQGQGANEQIFTATIIEATEDKITLDFNHPLAGNNLNFDIEIVSVEETETASDT
jgi:FKBP-type peptidyl-prolyl cis-trans isomerase 2